MLGSSSGEPSLEFFLLGRTLDVLLASRDGFKPSLEFHKVCVYDSGRGHK